MGEPDERLILVNERDEAVGIETKRRCHKGAGLLHRAFSVYLFDHRKRLLIQQRSAEKPLWPMFWSNSCCSHPRDQEESEAAAHRRVREELGLNASLQRLFKFQYHAAYPPVGSEREVCSVYVGMVEEELAVDPYEVANWKFEDSEQLDVALLPEDAPVTPWFRLAWRTLRDEHWAAVESLISSSKDDR